MKSRSATESSRKLRSLTVKFRWDWAIKFLQIIFYSTIVSSRIKVWAVYRLLRTRGLTIPDIVKLFETITFLRETKMNIASLELRLRSRFQASLVSFLGNSHRPDTAIRAPFTPSSSRREDRYVNTNVLEMHLVSDAKLTFPSLIFFEHRDESWAPISRSSRLFASQNLDRVQKGSLSHCV